MSFESKSPVLGFLVIFALGSIFSYGATILLLLPCLYLLSKLTMLKFHLVCLLGAVLGFVVFFPCAWVDFRASGTNSGPPEGPFIEFLARSWGDSITWMFPVGGLVTAAVYWIVVNKTPQRDGRYLE